MNDEAEAFEGFAVAVEESEGWGMMKLRRTTHRLI